MNPHQLNFHHLRYFWAVASDGNLTRTAKALGVSQSALSAQIRQLEDQLDHQLFARERGRLRLTEAGELVQAYADQIFTTGEELLRTLEHGRRSTTALRIGAVATLSRNFQDSFLEPLLHTPDLHLRMVSGSFDDLLGQLGRHDIDLMLANQPAPARETGHHEPTFSSRRLARQAVSLIGPPRTEHFRFPKSLHGVPLLVPSKSSDIRLTFDAICAERGITPHIVAEVDDMAMMRLLARDSRAVALLPSVVVRDELKSGLLQEYGVVPGLFEHFFAITTERRFPHPLERVLLKRRSAELL
jgi:LysR family transcriptional activator of nhaA